MQGNTPQIRRLPEAAANRIAAGEVVERPASAVKELVENAIDAGARRVRIAVADAGKTLIRVADDGAGIPADELALALERHATSKIDGSDLLHILTYGFRGEALPSIASVARLTLTSRAAGAGEARAVEARAGTLAPPRPAAHPPGTTVEVRDLFAATPARLKFLRSDRAELTAISESVRRLALAEPGIGFRLEDLTGGASRTVFSVDPAPGDDAAARLARIEAILGASFAGNAVPVEADREGLRLTGFAGLPTYSRGAAVQQFFFVNGRPVRDKLLIGALRAAYADVMSRDRHPVAVLFLDCPPERVDVNVHPAKAEIRFREPGIARGLVVSALRHALAGAGHRTASTVSEAALGAFREEPGPAWRGPPRPARPAAGAISAALRFDAPDRAPADAPEADEPAVEAQALPLGAARAQLHRTYIVAESAEGMVLVDQHAAHERLVFERLKRQTAERGVARQALLVPEVVPLGADAAALILAHAPGLSELGLVVEPFGGDAVCVREVPALIGQADPAALVRDIADELADLGTSETLGARIDAVLSRMSCHGSVRAGRAMRRDEMDALLREMEATPGSGQCNHGRPTHVVLSLDRIETLFGRR